MRLIEADALLEVIAEQERWNVPDFVYESIKNAPIIDAEPVRHGRWIGKPISGCSTVRCSVCGDVFLENKGKWEYCPHCGARMDEMNDEAY